MHVKKYIWYFLTVVLLSQDFLFEGSTNKSRNNFCVWNLFPNCLLNYKTEWNFLQTFVRSILRRVTWYMNMIQSSLVFWLLWAASGCKRLIVRITRLISAVGIVAVLYILYSIRINLPLWKYPDTDVFKIIDWSSFSFEQCQHFAITDCAVSPIYACSASYEQIVQHSLTFQKPNQPQVANPFHHNIHSYIHIGDYISSLFSSLFCCSSVLHNILHLVCVNNEMFSFHTSKTFCLND